MHVSTYQHVFYSPNPRFPLCTAIFSSVTSCYLAAPGAFPCYKKQRLPQHGKGLVGQGLGKRLHQLPSVAASPHPRERLWKRRKVSGRGQAAGKGSASSPYHLPSARDFPQSRKKMLAMGKGSSRGEAMGTALGSSLLLEPFPTTGKDSISILMCTPWSVLTFE